MGVTEDPNQQQIICNLWTVLQPTLASNASKYEYLQRN